MWDEQGGFTEAVERQKIYCLRQFQEYMLVTSRGY